MSPMDPAPVGSPPRSSKGTVMAQAEARPLLRLPAGSNQVPSPAGCSIHTPNRHLSKSTFAPSFALVSFAFALSPLSLAFDWGGQLRILSSALTGALPFPVPFPLQLPHIAALGWFAAPGGVAQSWKGWPLPWQLRPYNGGFSYPFPLFLLLPLPKASRSPPGGGQAGSSACQAASAADQAASG